MSATLDHPRLSTGLWEIGGVNRDTGTMSYRVTYSGLSGAATAGHIHGPAGPGANAGVAVPFANAASPISGEVKLTPEQLTQLSSGQWYVNIHTARNPGGEIRGQLVAVPEPSAAFLGLAASGLCLRRRR